MVYLDVVLLDVDVACGLHRLPLQFVLHHGEGAAKLAAVLDEYLTPLAHCIFEAVRKEGERKRKKERGAAHRHTCR